MDRITPQQEPLQKPPRHACHLPSIFLSKGGDQIWNGGTQVFESWQLLEATGVTENQHSQTKSLRADVARDVVKAGPGGKRGRVRGTETDFKSQGAEAGAPNVTPGSMDLNVRCKTIALPEDNEIYSPMLLE
ncbi:hypothetical protein H8959_016904 [Pygathrix nigripes]